MNPVTVIGGGLAGCEAALQLSSRGVPVRMYEMRPDTPTGAHRGAGLAEIVCSNSFKSTRVDNASGLLKAEMDLLGCRLLGFARDCAVPAGHALGVDREMFSEAVTAAISADTRIELIRQEVGDLNFEGAVLVATGPLTGKRLTACLQERSPERLYFYDAIAPSLDGESIPSSTGFWASRYGKGGDDYLNIPLDRQAYDALVKFIRAADTIPGHEFEEERYFEACLPIEVLAARGDDVLRYGPMKPRGLVDPSTGREPWAAIQLRQESRTGSLLGMVGFQTRMTWPEQKKMIQSLPGMERVRILRYGTIHRNMFLNTPELCARYLRDSVSPQTHYAGQICGVEGYVESIMSAMVAAFDIVSGRIGASLSELPAESMIGALMNYVHTPTKNFQPMNANMGLVPRPRARRKDRRARNEAVAATALESLSGWKGANPHLFDPTGPESAL